jgi:cathepsin L
VFLAMSFRVLLLSLIAAVSAVDLNNYSFEQYVVEFNLNYQPAEVETRKSLFNAELARVRAHNEKNLSWQETMNRFSCMTPAEKKAFGGRSKNHAALHSTLKNGKPLPADFVMKPLSALPRSVDWRKEGIVSAVKDQGHCGSCWAFAGTSVIESHVAKNTGLLFDLSVEQMAMCAPNPDKCGGTGGCSGATAEIAFDYVTKSGGLFQEYQYSYSSYYGSDYACALPSTGAPVATINGFVQLPENNYTALMNAVAQLGPIAVSVDASTFHAYSKGIHDGCNQVNPDINHAVVLVGYGSEDGKDFWLIRNSWNPKYGEAGYIKLLRTNDEEGRCGSDITPQDGTACDGHNEPVKVCGTCGVLYDSAYPLNARVV